MGATKPILLTFNRLQTTNAALKKEVTELKDMLQAKDAEAKANDVKLREAATVARAGGESIQAQLESEIESMRAEKKQSEGRIAAYQKEIQVGVVIAATLTPRLSETLSLKQTKKRRSLRLW